MISLCRHRYNRRVKENQKNSFAVPKAIVDQVTTWIGVDRGQLVWETLRVEASHRRFYRVTGLEQSAIVMLSPPELEANDQFIALSQVFAQAGVPVPHITHVDREQGLMLMSDLGTTHLQDTYGTPKQDAALSAAIEGLFVLGPIQNACIPEYTAERLSMEVGIYSEWLRMGLLGETESTEHDLRLTQVLIDVMLAQPQACVHRDYHCRNLLFEHNQLGIVDYQDALHGPASYDLATLFTDCYHTFEDAVIDHWLQTFLNRVPENHPLAGTAYAELRRWVHFTGMQRQIKAVGIFARLHLRDQKSSHLKYIDDNLARVAQRAYEYPELAALAEQISQDHTRYLEWQASNR